MRNLVRLIPLILLAVLVSCGLAAEPTSTPSPTPSPTSIPPTPTPTRIPPTPTPSPTSSPTPTPSPTSTPTPAGLEWSRYPNALDFRAVLPSVEGDSLWLAALSGLVKVDQLGGEWTVFTRADGLADNSLVSLARQGDSLWIGTQGGVSRYNLENDSWRNYTTEDGLSSNREIVVYLDGDTVWAGTRNGLSWFDPSTDRWDSFYSAAGMELFGIDGILGDGRFLWVSVTPQAEANGGLFRLDKATGEWESISGEETGLPFGPFTLTQSDDVLWAIPRDGLPWEFNKETGLWRQIIEIDPSSARPGDTYLGGQYHAGALWLFDSFTEELVRYSPLTRQVGRYAAGPVTSVGLQGQIVGQDNTLWFTGRDGLLAFHLQTGEWDSLRRDVGIVYRILGERDGTLLIHSNLGPGFLEPEGGHWQPLAPVGGAGMVFPDASALERGTQSVWLAENLSRGSESSDPPRLLFFNEPGVEPQRYDLTPPAGWDVHFLLPQSVGSTLWFVGSRGFLSYNPAIDQWGVFELDGDALPAVRHALQQDNIVWFVTDTDLGRFDTNTGAYSLAPLPVTPAIPPALAVAQDVLWLLADGNLFRGNPESGEWALVEIGAPCLDEATLLAFWDGALWMGGAHGVGRIEPDGGSWFCYAPADGMMDTVFEQLFPADDALWFGHSQRGLWRYQER